MELRQVRYFVEVAEKLNFTRAADKIGIAQPALSQQIKQLEIELGGNLFVRTKRKVMLTNAGTLFLAEAKLLLEQAEHAKDIARQVFSGLSGKLVIGFVESSTWEILPKILSIYSKKYPNVKIVLRHLHTNNQVEALKNNTIDIGIIGLPINDSALHIHTIRKDHYWVALQKGHPLSCQKKIHITDLSNERIRELATLKVLGFYRKEMKRLVLRENIWITIFGLPFGYIFGTLLLRAILDQAATPDLEILPVVNFFNIVVGFTFMLMFTMFVNYTMGRKFKSIDMVASLKSVE